jgi:hypothetical protein
MTLKRWLARVNGTEICLIPGLYWGLVGIMRDTESDSLAIGLGVARVLVRWPKPEETPKAEAHAPSTKCPVCGDPILEGDATETLPTPPIFPITPPRVHEECFIFTRYGRAGCQRGECPNCDPPAGQSIRDQARDAAEFYRASKGRRGSKKEAAS